MMFRHPKHPFYNKIAIITVPSLRVYNHIMTKKFPLYTLLSLILMGLISACNKDSENFVAEGDFSNCTVSSFSLAKDDSVIKGLDSVYFSIDLVNAIIFNADSLPKGTKTSKLIVKIGTSSARGCDLTFRRTDVARDTTISYIDSPNDSINFSDGPVKLLVTSYDGQSKREYTIKVNVHQVEPDTLYWDKASCRRLPSTLAAPTAQKTVKFQGKIYCLTATDTEASLAVTSDPFANEWTTASATLPANASVKSFTATDDAFYILDTDGSLYKSADALTWAPTDCRMNYIYGGYETSVLGARKDDDGWKHVTYPAIDAVAIPNGCPVSGTGQMILYETKWSSQPLAMFVGGRDANGTLVGSTWAYDGNIWAKISSRDIDEREGVTLIPYFAVRVNKATWRVTERTVLLAAGGRFTTALGDVVSKRVYASYDQGLTWEEASSYLQLPDFIPGFAYAQAVVSETELDENTSRSADGWTYFSGNTLPVWATPVPLKPTSRVSAPITEWECPYIYLFGGENFDGSLHDTLWRGVIRRFTFKPLY